MPVNTVNIAVNDQTDEIFPDQQTLDEESPLNSDSRPELVQSATEAIINEEELVTAESSKQEQAETVDASQQENQITDGLLRSLWF